MRMTEALLTPNQWSRPCKPMLEIWAIAVHWYLNAGQSARGAVAWWEQRKDGRHGYGSGHYAIDDSGIILAVPTTERAYHVGALPEEQPAFTRKYLDDPNAHCIGIELAHADWTGKPSDSVWANLVELCAILCELYAIPESMILTHWDITGTRPHWNGLPCHRWFVEQPGELARLQADVRERRNAP